MRGYIANRVADSQMEKLARAEFYRNLRQIKLRRYAIARELRLLAEQTGSLRQGLARVESRYPDLPARPVDEAYGLVDDARRSVDTAADEFTAFARRRIYWQGLAA